MTYSEARNHFEKGKNDTVDRGIIEMLDGLKHLSHAIEEDFRTLERDIRDIRDTKKGQQAPHFPT